MHHAWPFLAVPQAMAPSCCITGPLYLMFCVASTGSTTTCSILLSSSSAIVCSLCCPSRLLPKHWWTTIDSYHRPIPSNLHLSSRGPICIEPHYSSVISASNLPPQLGCSSECLYNWTQTELHEALQITLACLSAVQSLLSN